MAKNVQRRSGGGQRSPLPKHDDVELSHFEEACELVRHYSSLRFRQLTIYVALNGGLLFVLFRQAGTVSVHHLLGFIVLGTLAAVAFALLEIRLHQYLDHYRKVVAHYERRFGLTESLYHPERRTWLFQGRLAVLMFIAGSIGLWIFLGILAMPVSQMPV